MNGVANAVISSSVIQYGFAGFSIILISLVVYLVLIICRMNKAMLKAVMQNTQAYHGLISMLNDRPCLHNDRALTHTPKVFGE